MPVTNSGQISCEGQSGKDQYRALVVGLGSIGLYYDWGCDTDEKVLTHSHAFSLHEHFSLVAGVDPSAQAQRDFQQRFNRPAFSCLDDIPDSLSFDVVVIANPTPFHVETFLSVVNRFNPRCVLCEKPVGYSLQDIERISQQCVQTCTDFFVNYIRRSDPGTRQIKQYLALDDENPAQGVVWYSKGFVHNGSHFVDLLSFLLGGVVSANVVEVHSRSPNGDFLADIDLSFRYGRVSFKSLGANMANYNSLELFCRKGWLEYKEGGRKVCWHPNSDMPAQDGYYLLSGENLIIPTEMARYQWHVVQDLHRELQGERTDLCRIGDAKIIHQIVSELVV